jgi:hypothetical protein
MLHGSCLFEVLTQDGSSDEKLNAPKSMILSTVV